MGFGFTIGSGPFGSWRLRKTVLRHFGVSAGEIATAGRQFPITARVDIQSALEDLLQNRTGTKLLGIVSPNRHEAPALAQILGGHFPLDGGTLEHEEIDVGEPVPVRCLKNGLWLSREKDLPFAIMMAPGDLRRSPGTDCQPHEGSQRGIHQRAHAPMRPVPNRILVWQYSDAAGRGRGN